MLVCRGVLQVGLALNRFQLAISMLNRDHAMEN